LHPLRTFLFVTLVIAAFVAMGFGFLLHRVAAAHLLHDVGESQVIALSIAVFLAFCLPWGGVFAWAVRRANDLDTLAERSRRLVAGAYELPVADRQFHGEVDDIARAVEELRAMLLREKASFAEQRATMAQIVASLGEGLIALSARGRIVFANERVTEMLGSDPHLIGRSLLEVVRAPSLVDAFERALAGETSSGRIVLDRGLAGGSEPRHVEIRVFPVASSTEIAAVALFIDFTQIERLQRIRRDFLDDFSHEVRTPLAGLRSATETFESGGLTGEQEEHLRRIMLRQLSRIERLMQDLSELHRIESGELRLERQPVDVREMLLQLCDDFRERIASRPVPIVVEGSAARALLDPVRGQQIFSNLLDNAWKHGGSRGEIYVEVAEEDSFVVVRISDAGSGIPPQELDRIFNRFYRVDKSRSQDVPGAGLGLAIAKHLVLQHGGSIRAVNRANGGATFEVRLPLA
jgi:PAS domain S-box-containing protein